MALAGKSSGKNSGTVTKVRASTNSEPFWTPSVGSLERLGRVFGAYMSKYLSLWILQFSLLLCGYENNPSRRNKWLRA